MIEYRIKYKGTMIGVWLNGEKGNIILAPGVPQYISKHHPFVKQVNRLGYNLFVPRYIGSWESEGVFSLNSSVKSIELAIEFVGGGEAVELYGNSYISWKLENTYLIGFSYGALVAMMNKYDINKKVLICPFWNMDFHLGRGGGENIEKTFNFVADAYPNIYRLNPEKLISEVAKSRLSDFCEKQKLAVVAGAKDKVIPQEEIDLLLKKYKNAKVYKSSSGHSLNVSDSLLKLVFNDM